MCTKLFEKIIKMTSLSLIRKIYIVFKERGIHNYIEVLFKMSQANEKNSGFYSNS
jgi:hypothetical protein